MKFIFPYDREWVGLIFISIYNARFYQALKKAVDTLGFADRVLLYDFDLLDNLIDRPKPFLITILSDYHEDAQR